MSILVWTCHTGDCILQYYQYICHKGKVPYLNCWRIFCSVTVIVTLLFVLDTYTTAAPFFRNMFDQWVFAIIHVLLLPWSDLFPCICYNCDRSIIFSISVLSLICNLRKVIQKFATSRANKTIEMPSSLIET